MAHKGKSNCVIFMGRNGRSFSLLQKNHPSIYPFILLFFSAKNGCQWKKVKKLVCSMIKILTWFWPLVVLILELSDGLLSRKMNFSKKVAYIYQQNHVDKNIYVENKRLFAGLLWKLFLKGDICNDDCWCIKLSCWKIFFQFRSRKLCLGIEN